MADAGQLLRAELTNYGPVGNYGRLVRAQMSVDATDINNGILIKAELSRVYTEHIAGELLRAELEVLPGISAGDPQTDIEPWSKVTLQGTDSAGTVGVLRMWVQTYGITAPDLAWDGATATYTAPADVVERYLTFSYRVDDQYAYVNHTILPVTERAVIGGVEVPLHLMKVQES